MQTEAWLWEAYTAERAGELVLRSPSRGHRSPQQGSAHVLVPPRALLPNTVSWWVKMSTLELGGIQSLSPQ